MSRVKMRAYSAMADPRTRFFVEVDKRIDA